MNRHGWVVMALLFLGALAGAQETPSGGKSDEKKVQSETKPKDKQEEPKERQAKPDKEVVITGTRSETLVTDIPQSMTVITEEKLSRQQARTPNQVLREEPGIWSVQVSAQGSPIIRGMIGNRVLYLWDGIRINNGALFGGPNAFFNEFPLGTLDRMEVIRGPGAVQYGSDAIGGVVNILSKRPEFTKDLDYGGDAYARFGSVDRESTQWADLWVANPLASVLVGGTGQHSDDYRGPREGRIRNTGFDALGGYGKLSVHPADGQTAGLSFIENERTNVDSYTSSKLNPSGVPRNFTPIERRWIGKVDYTFTDPAPFLKNLTPYLYDQSFVTTRNLATENATTITTTRTDAKQIIYGGGLQGTVPLDLFVPSKLVFGADYRMEHLWSSKTVFAKTKSTGAETQTTPLGNVPDGTYDAFDAFAITEWRPSTWLTLTMGGRFETPHLKSDPEPNDVLTGFTIDDFTLNQRWSSWTWNAGAVVWLTDELSLAGNIARGFRAPTFSDTLSVGPPVFSTLTASVPSKGVGPEHSITYEVGPRYSSDNLSATVAVYYTSLSDLIVQVDAGTVDIGGVTYQARKNENAGRGYIWGVEAGAAWRIFDQWTLFGNFAVTRGQDTQSDVPLRFIPPMNGLVGIRWESNPRKWWAEGNVVLVNRLFRHAPQDELDAGFSQDPGLGSPNTTTNPPYRQGFEIPGYAVLNLRAGVEVFRGERSSLSLTLDLNNLLDMHYREAYSQQQIEAPGRGVVVGAMVKF